MAFMDMILAFKSLQNIKEIRHRDVTPIEALQVSFHALHTVYEVQREQESEESGREEFGQRWYREQNHKDGKGQKVFRDGAYTNWTWWRVPTVRVEDDVEKGSRATL